MKTPTLTRKAAGRLVRSDGVVNAFAVGVDGSARVEVKLDGNGRARPNQLQVVWGFWQKRRERRERDSVDIFCETSTGHGNETHSSLDVGGSWMLAIFVLYLRIFTEDGALEIAGRFP